MNRETGDSTILANLLGQKKSLFLQKKSFLSRPFIIDLRQKKNWGLPCELIKLRKSIHLYVGNMYITEIGNVQASYDRKTILL